MHKQIWHIHDIIVKT